MIKERPSGGACAPKAAGAQGPGDAGHALRPGEGQPRSERQHDHRDDQGEIMRPRQQLNPAAVYSSQNPRRRSRASSPCGVIIGPSVSGAWQPDPARWATSTSASTGPPYPSRLASVLPYRNWPTSHQKRSKRRASRVLSQPGQRLAGSRSPAVLCIPPWWPPVTTTSNIAQRAAAALPRRSNLRHGPARAGAAPMRAVRPGSHDIAGRSRPRCDELLTVGGDTR